MRVLAWPRDQRSRGEWDETPEPEPEPAKPEEKEPLSLEDVLTDIYTVAPGTAGSSLRATYAAGELLD